MNLPDSLHETGALNLIGERISRQRLDRNLTQAELATSAGVSKRTIERLEAGESTQLSNFLRILRALDLLDGINQLISEPPPSPLEQLRLKGRHRQRASSIREPESPSASWKWSDDK
jgi:transcriptional regulator with XRE-family HTH domain